MNKRYFTLTILCSLVSFILFPGCEKESTAPGPGITVPKVTTGALSMITPTSVQCGGTITSDGGASVTACGICWCTNQMPTTSDSITSDSTGTGSFTSSLTGLEANSTYYIRAYATNSIGTGYGNEVSFITSEYAIPTLLTNAVSMITPISAECEGTIISDGGKPINWYGILWSAKPDISIDTDSMTTLVGRPPSNFTFSLRDLCPNTTYYVRAYAHTNFGVGLGNEVSFTTTDFERGTVTDIDGNTYNTVKLSEQWWMVGNLKVTHYRNGEAIPNIVESEEWFNLTTGAYCNYNNDEANVATYGRLYNWYVVNDSRGIAPTGWHVPTEEECVELMDFFGGLDVVPSNMTEKGANVARPGGHRISDFVEFSGIGEEGYWWLDDYEPEGEWDALAYTFDDFLHDYKGSGLSIRCIKD
jgi:uncharacterized protein (TIGR02145 family)